MPRRLRPGARKFLLTVHIAASVGWLGMSLCLLVLDLTGVFSTDPRLQKAVFTASSTLATTIGPPVAIAAFASGVAISLGTKWGLWRHWWVVVSLVGTGIMTVLVVFSLGPMLTEVATAALAAPPGVPVLDAVGDRVASAIAAPSVAVVALTVLTGLNVFKPRGRVRRR